MFQAYSLKRFPKAILQSGSRKLLRKVATETYPRKLRSKINSQSCSLRRRFFKPVLRSCRAKLLPKAAPKSCAPKLLPKIVLRNCMQGCPRKLVPKAIIFQSNCSAKLIRKIGQSYAPKPKLFPKLPLQNSCPRATILQIYSSKWIPKAAPESWSPKLCPKIAVQSCHAKLLLKAAPASQNCSPKHRHKAVAPKLLYFKPIPQAVPQSPKLFSKAAPESCSVKLLPKAAKLRFFKISV